MTGKKKQVEILQLRISLRDTKPEVWRRIIVMPSLTLGHLHDIIQCVMPWDDCHLHQFSVGGKRYGMVEREDGGEIEDEHEIELSSVFGGRRKSIDYVYDFGDWWEHEVVFEKAGVVAADDFPIACIGGDNACPPEDSGSVPGYYQKLSILMDHSHPEHQEVKDWMPEGFNPRHFDVDEANGNIAAFVLDEVDEAVPEGLLRCRWCGELLEDPLSAEAVGLTVADMPPEEDLAGRIAVILRLVKTDHYLVADLPLPGTSAKAEGVDLLIPLCGKSCYAELDAALKKTGGALEVMFAEEYAERMGIDIPEDDGPFS